MNPNQNSQWRNWLINFCFLMAGLMLGAKLSSGGKSKPARDSKAPASSRLVDAGEDAASIDTDSVFQNNDRAVDLDEPIYDEFAESQVMKASGSGAKASEPSLKSRLVEKAAAKSNPNRSLTKDEMVVRKKTATSPSTRNRQTSQIPNVRQGMEDPVANDVASGQVDGSDESDASRWIDDEPTGPTNREAIPNNRVAEASQPTVAPGVTPQHRRLPPQRVAAPQSPQRRTPTPRPAVVQLQRPTSPAQRVAYPQRVGNTRRVESDRRVRSVERIERIPLGPIEVRHVQPTVKTPASGTRPVHETRAHEVVENELQRLQRDLEQFQRDK